MGALVQMSLGCKAFMMIGGSVATPEYMPVSASRRLTVCGHSLTLLSFDKLAVVQRPKEALRKASGSFPRWALSDLIPTYQPNNQLTN